jgi:hypothetical protein
MLNPLNWFSSVETPETVKNSIYEMMIKYGIPQYLSDNNKQDADKATKEMQTNPEYHSLYDRLVAASIGVSLNEFLNNRSSFTPRVLNLKRYPESDINEFPEPIRDTPPSSPRMYKKESEVFVNRNDMTPEEIEQVISELYKIGINFNKGIQSFITSDELYPFVYRGKTINDFLTPMINQMSPSLYSRITSVINNPVQQEEPRDQHVNEFEQPIRSIEIDQRTQDRYNARTQASHERVNWDWNKLMFYLKGGKALYNLVKRIDNELEVLNSNPQVRNLLNGYQLVYSDFEKQHAIKSGLADGSNTDYDFNLVISDLATDYDANPKDICVSCDMYSQHVRPIIKDEYTFIKWSLEQNLEFQEFKTEFLKHINKSLYNSSEKHSKARNKLVYQDLVGDLAKFAELLSKLKEIIDIREQQGQLETVSERLTHLKNTLGIEWTGDVLTDKFLKIKYEFLELKQVQMNNLNQFFESKKFSQEFKFFESCEIVAKTPTRDGLISIDKDGTIEQFYLCRLYLMLNVNTSGYTNYLAEQGGRKVYKSFGKDLRSYFNADFNPSDHARDLPWPNTFGEFIDISISVGKSCKRMIPKSDIKYILKPVYGIDGCTDLTRYPMINLKFQIKDTLQIFNSNAASKLRKRCARFIDFLKMTCYSESTPDEFELTIKSSLLNEIKQELKEAQGKSESDANKIKTCHKMQEFLNRINEKYPDYHIATGQSPGQNVTYRLSKELINEHFGEICKWDLDTPEFQPSDHANRKVSQVALHTAHVHPELLRIIQELYTTESFGAFSGIIPVNIVGTAQSALVRSTDHTVPLSAS